MFDNQESKIADDEVRLPPVLVRVASRMVYKKR